MGALIAESVNKFQGIQKQWKRAIKEIEHTDKKILKEYSYYQSLSSSAVNNIPKYTLKRIYPCNSFSFGPCVKNMA